MAKKEIKVIVRGLDTEEDMNWFAEKCSQLWMDNISKKISGLSVSYETKKALVERVVNEIHNKNYRREIK